MVFSNKINKFLMIMFLSILFISTNSSKVLANSKSPVDINKQIQFLEEKRISQSKVLEERQKNATVEGMLSSKDVENRRNAEIKKEKKIKKEQKEEIDTFSEVVKTIRKLQSKKRKARQSVHKEVVNEIAEVDSDYEDEDILITADTMYKADRKALSEPVSSINSGIIKDLIDQPVPNSAPIDMGYSDIDMLERIVMAESGGEPYLGQIAVANVVLNRVKSNKYPKTLKGVIFQKSQFSPVKNGVIRGRAPNESVKKAVAEALNGRMIVPEDTLYFVNPVLATDQTVPRTKTTVKVIGSHTFYK